MVDTRKLNGPLDLDAGLLKDGLDLDHLVRTEAGISSQVPGDPENETDDAPLSGQHAAADLDSYPYNDLGNAERFRDLNGAEACYVPDHRRWYRFNGKIWEPDASGGEVRLLARRVQWCESDVDDGNDEGEGECSTDHAYPLRS